ncbi:MAG: ATP-binding cassette domain-containing protein [Tepidisphaeraceae bacterium]
MIAVHDLTIHAGAFRLEGLSFEVGQGQYVAVMGPTGCGKTTVIECICGLRPLDRGRIVLGGRDVTHLRPAERGIGYVPQDAALFPTMTVYQHLAFALRLRKLSRRVIDQRVWELAGTLGLTPLLARLPARLSGGEAQRVALGRALSLRPAILCLDEPLNALDRDTQDRMCELLQTVTRQSAITTLHFTHEAREAERLADSLLTLGT